MVEISEKWGFGMAPPKLSTLAQRDTSARSVIRLLDGLVEPTTLESLSVVKGMFNRVWRQDQWDWFTVYAALGYPSSGSCRSIGGKIAEIRQELKNNGNTPKNDYVTNSLKVCLENYIGDRIIVNEEYSGWLYMLSTREFPELIKIGMTTRSVQDRVREINSATGVPIPYGVRGCWKVKDPKRAERAVHDALDAWRFRNDREFFKIPYGVANKIISDLIRDNDLELRNLRIPPINRTSE